jgi:hypothetical protein
VGRVALALLICLCVQVAVCIGSGDCASGGPDCCHDCACCSLYVGFPAQIQLPSIAPIQRIDAVAALRTIERSGPRIERPPRVS